MSDAMENFLDGLEDDGFANAARKSTSIEKIQYPCEVCGGRGKVEKAYGYSEYTRRVYVNKCKACNGRGHFFANAETRAKRRASATASKGKKLEAKREAFEAAHPGLAAFLADAASWSGFANSLTAAILQYGGLTEPQEISATKMRTKCEANAAKREAEKVATREAVDLAAIRTMFDAAIESGKKKPTYRAEGLVISKAPDHGRNAGALYVKDGHAYAGKIIGAAFEPVRDAAADVIDRLRIIAADPADAAIRYGRETGSCSCCGRELTRADSIAAGIGPICAMKWGF